MSTPLIPPPPLPPKKRTVNARLREEIFEDLKRYVVYATLSTVHATSAQQGLSRFTSCVLQSGIDLPYHAIKSNIADSLNVIVQLERRPGQRLVSEVLEIKGYDPEADRYDFTPLYLREEEICRH